MKKITSLFFISFALLFAPIIHALNYVSVVTYGFGETEHITVKDNIASLSIVNRAVNLRVLQYAGVVAA